SGDIGEADLRVHLSRAFERIGKCCRRALAGLRRRLDVIVAARLQGPIDLETIELMLDEVAAEFARSATQTAAATAKRAMVVAHQGRAPGNWVKNDYGGLRPHSQHRWETALSELAQANRAVKAATVFATLAAALEAIPADHHPPSTALRSNYVSDLARLWR